MALGDLAFEETGKFAGIRALPDGKVEATYQGTGKLFGADYSSIYTGVATPHGGTLIAEFNGICITKDGDTIGVWAHGRGRPTGSGLKASWRGGVIWQASSPKFARLNSLPGVWELDIDEGGRPDLLTVAKYVCGFASDCFSTTLQNYIYNTIW